MSHPSVAFLTASADGGMHVSGAMYALRVEGQEGERELVVSKMETPIRTSGFSLSINTVMAGVTTGTLVCYGYLEDTPSERLGLPHEWDNGPIYMFLMPLDTWEWEIVDLSVLGAEWGADLAGSYDFSVDPVAGQVVAKGKHQVWSYDVDTGDVTLLPPYHSLPFEEMVLGRTVVSGENKRGKRGEFEIEFSDLVSGDWVRTTGEREMVESSVGERDADNADGDESSYEDDDEGRFVHLTQMGHGSLCLVKVETWLHGIYKAELLHVEPEVAVDVTSYAKCSGGLRPRPIWARE
ncbi:hypothetical protein KIPB_007025 [Kipferlia bialata]|uniref:Uncharacterized protein n=1 Tax=Kipferlia bialata TaxID=797122 RepID=A0A9K3D0J2_9EUKA|nr:hypothetical protein KIPB_007025 [Kipferlia bialata]|eukprot:g7025.t1